MPFGKFKLERDFAVVLSTIDIAKSEENGDGMSPSLTIFTEKI